jgi:hypothetical protein
MSLLHVEGVTHWSIPVNNLEEAEAFYGDLLGLTPVGRLGTAQMSCFTAGAHHILLCERAATVDHTFVEDPKVHHSFTVSPETLVRACKVFRGLCRKFCSGGQEGAVALVCGEITRPGNRTVQPQ